jgi:hypothetical protein
MEELQEFGSQYSAVSNRQEGAYLNGYATDPAAAWRLPDSRRPIFNATHWAAASWLFFHVARSPHINSDMGASLAPLKSAN